MHKVISVQPLPGFLLELTFEDGLRKVVDIRPFIGYDFCPNFLYDEIPAVSPVAT